MNPIEQAVNEFLTLTRRYALFHALFLSVFVLELLTLLLFMPFLAKSVGLAITVALTFLTIFSYLVLRFYFQTKKPQQFIALRDQFLKSWPSLKEASILPNTAAERLRPIYTLIERLHGQESQYYSVPSFFKTLAPLVEKFSVWCHWEDVHWMKEALHLQALRKILDWIKLHPMELELHRLLAAAHIAFYRIYQRPTLANETSEVSFYGFVERQYKAPAMRERFEKAARLAIEELNVILTYIPHDPWALAEIARVYHDLNLKQEEKKAYEALLAIAPQESEIHYQLGKLYFELGHMAQGLHLYQELKGRKDPKAQQLIEHYDAYYSLELDTI